LLQTLKQIHISKQLQTRKSSAYSRHSTINLRNSFSCSNNSSTHYPLTAPQIQTTVPHIQETAPHIQTKVPHIHETVPNIKEPVLRNRNRNRQNRIILTQEEPEPYPFSRFRFLLHKKYQTKSTLTGHLADTCMKLAIEDKKNQGNRQEFLSKKYLKIQG
jgi:hypothetical protein